MVVPRGGLRQFNQINGFTQKWDNQCSHTIIMLSGASVPPPKDLFLDVKDKILTIDLPHELRAKFNSLLELLFGLAL